jgi:PhoPQ-activated pathogenicity-related protein
VVAVLMQAPYQPIDFPDVAAPLKEDALIAYSWDKAIETGDYSWPAYLPMVKAAVRAMDTVQDFVPDVASSTVERFVVIGASKRGAATWLTPVVDPRVAAIAPMVIDFLNLPEQMAHHLAVYGDYAPAIQDYVDYRLPQRIGTPEGAALVQVVDPYAYRNRLAVPKYIIGSSGDQFFPPDAARFYFDDLPGEKLLRYVPDSDHSLSNSPASLLDTVSGLFAWYRTIVEDKPRPVITWERDGDSVLVHSSRRPLAARLWKARNPDARDFRLGSLGEAWRVSELKPVSRGEYAVRVVTPPTGWKAWFVELAYASPQPGLCQVYSTEIFVVPETRPYEGALPPPAPSGALRSAALSSPSSLLDGIFDDVAEEVHDGVLDEVDGDLGKRALRYCFARKIDELDEAVELYARLGFGQSPDAVLEQRLEELWDDVRHKGRRLVDDVRDFGDDVADEVDDAIDDLF